MCLVLFEIFRAETDQGIRFLLMNFNCLSDCAIRKKITIKATSGYPRYTIWYQSNGTLSMCCRCWHGQDPLVLPGLYWILWCTDWLSKPYQHLKSNLGTIHITVYLPSGRVLVQGTCYLLWHAKHLPHLMNYMYKAVTPSLENRPNDAPKPVDNPGTTIVMTESSWSVYDYQDNEDMMICDACEQWLHCACTKLFSQKGLRSTGGTK